MQKNNQLKQDKSVDVEIERLYRIAAENGHYKANINLQNGAMRQHFKLHGHEHLRLSQQLIEASVATGYYFVGIFLQQGSAGLKQDPEMALRYYRRSADQGSAQGQYYVGDKLDPIDVAPEIAVQMYQCAAEQGHDEAAVALGIYLKHKEQYREALEVLQMGVAAGNSEAAGRLDDAFRGPPVTNKLDYLGQQEDPERAERYEKIWRILARASYANPTVPEINEIVPLPPAKLPAWDSKLQWLEARRANVPPEKPSQALINQLAKAKLLDPTTGKGLPGSAAFSQAHLSAPYCYSGQVCPSSERAGGDPTCRRRTIMRCGRCNAASGSLVGAKLAGEGVLEGLFAGKPGSYSAVFPSMQGLRCDESPGPWFPAGRTCPGSPSSPR
ncbi:sel1 repeat family protein [Pseudomonas sp. NPDC087336]|uniref:SEL1-like repeat protein n=1 Tax=Pseudomonas sp. NPDC087336 TaxID=3364436 RepID=UPI0037F83D40